MHNHQPQPWIKQITPADLLKAVVILVAVGVAWGNVNARLVAIEGEATERRQAREKIAGMSEDISVLKERSVNQDLTTKRIDSSVQRIERYLLNGKD